MEQKRWYDRNAREREFNEGDQVLVLLPTTTMQQADCTMRRTLLCQGKSHPGDLSD